MPSATPLDPAQLSLTCGRVHRLAKRLAGIPTSSTQWRALYLIDTYGPLPIGHFTRLDGQGRSTSTRQIRELTNGGLITSTTDPDDARSTLIAITPAGSQRRREYEQAVGASVAPVLASLSSAEQASIASALPALEHLVDALRRAHDSTLPAPPPTVGGHKTPTYSTPNRAEE